MSKGLSAEQLNKKIALDFIDDLTQRKQEDKIDTDGSDTHSVSKITFHKPASTNTEETPKSSLFGSAHGGKARVMKTYEIGQKVSFKKTKVTNEKESAVQEIVLKIDEEEEASTKNISEEIESIEKMEDIKGFVARKKKTTRKLRHREIEDEE